MGKVGKGKKLYVTIPCKLYAAILQDIDSRPRTVSAETVVIDCVRAKYAQTKVKRDYLVRADSEISNLPGIPSLISPRA